MVVCVLLMVDLVGGVTALQCCMLYNLWLRDWQSWNGWIVTLFSVWCDPLAVHCFLVVCADTCDHVITCVNMQTFPLSVGVVVWLCGWINLSFQTIPTMIHGLDIDLINMEVFWHDLFSGYSLQFTSSLSLSLYLSVYGARPCSLTPGLQSLHPLLMKLNY